MRWSVPCPQEDATRDRGPRRRKLLRLLLVPLVGTLSVVGSLATTFVVAQPAGAATTLFVSTGGSDSASCSVSAPCATITHALSLAGAGAVTIEVAGTIDDNVSVTTTVTVEHWPGRAPAEVDGKGLSNVFNVSTAGNLTVNGLTVTGGAAALGGGIFDIGVAVTVTDSTITNNEAGIVGGGIWSSPGAPLLITDSTIANNAAGSGGGIFDPGNALTITDSTVADNTVHGTGGVGGGIFSGGGATIGASIVATNTANGSTNNCSGIFTSVGYNMTDDTTGAACGFTQGTDMVNANPDLGPLATNGGPTETLLPSPTSPAVGVIPSPTTVNGVAVCGTGAFDQRGVPRPTPGPKCSIGAVEGAPGTAPSITSAKTTLFESGINGSFTVTTSGLPTPTLSVLTGPGQSGLPQGIGFNDNANGTATLAGVAATPGVSTFTITASNGVSPPATQTFTLVVQAPLSGGAAMAALPNGTGYWVVHPDGGVFSYGSAPFFGSLPGIGIHANDVVGIAVTPDGKGYWLVGTDGGVFTFGDAGFFGSMGGTHLNQPVMAMAASPSGAGYWLVASDGGVFSFGDAPFAGSMGATPLTKPVVAMTADPSGGYWLVASDGGLFTFGGAPFLGSMGGIALNKPMVGVTSAPGGLGYWMVASDGGVFTFGKAHFAGSLGGSSLNVIGLFSTNGGNDYTLVESNGTAHAF
jgi:hypothetical protein